MTDKTMPSESDDRVQNNIMRHNYRVLSEDEKRNMIAVKDMGLLFVNSLHDIGGTCRISGDRQSTRELSMAQTKIEEAVMWAVKHITA